VVVVKVPGRQRSVPRGEWNEARVRGKAYKKRLRPEGHGTGVSQQASSRIQHGRVGRTVLGGVGWRTSGRSAGKPDRRARREKWERQGPVGFWLLAVI